MNHDENNPPSENKSAAAELEARVVAWVAGEASAFEIAELERLVAAQPELAIFKRRIEAVHGLVAEAARPEPASLRLAPERRAKLLATIGAVGAADDATKTKGAAKPMTLPLIGSRQKGWRAQTWIVVGSAAAACLAIGVIVLDNRVTFGGGKEQARMLKVMEVEKKLAADVKRREESPREEATTLSVAMPTMAAPGLNLQNAPLAEKQKSGVVDVPSIDSLAISRTTSGFVTEADRSTIVWRSGNFNISTGETYNFQTPIGGAVLNKVGYTTSGADTATIAGNLTSGGRTFILADGSVRVTGGGANVNTQGTVASTLAESSDFAFTTRGSLGFSGASQGAKPAQAISGSLGAWSGATALNTVGNLTTGTLTATGKAFTSGDAATFGDIVKLDAFVVSADRDSGFAAASSMNAAPLNLFGIGSFTAPKGITLSSASAAKNSKAASTGGSDLAFLRGEVVTVAAIKPAANFAPQSDAVTLSAFTVSTEGRGRGRREELAKAKLDDDKPVARPAPQRVVPPADAEVRAAQEGTSTFSLHVGDVSFRLAQAALARGELPDPARIRAEEFYNALDYGDPAPSAAEKITARIEQAAHPVLQQRNLVRIALKVGATGRGPGTPLRLTVLLDTSGSMERDDRAATVRRALDSLASLLGPADRVSLIGFARTPRLIAEALPGDQAKSLAKLVAGIPPEGGTNMEEALKLAAELARRHRAEGAQNRIVLLTDGAANLGNAVPAQLAATVEGLRREGIALDACGIGLDGLDDEILETLTRHGDGRYTVLNSPEDADADFAKKLAGAFRPAAQNVKLQVRFNPARVGAWRLVGFEQHRMKAEDFRNDAVDAAELAAEEAAVALYQVEVLPQGEGEIGEVFVRFRDPTSGAMVERAWPIAHEARAPAFTRASPTLKLAGTAALLAEKLHGGTLAGQFKLSELAPTVTVLRNHYAGVARVEELAAMFDRARRLTGE